MANHGHRPQNVDDREGVRPTVEQVSHLINPLTILHTDLLKFGSLLETPRQAFECATIAAELYVVSPTNSNYEVALGMANRVINLVQSSTVVFQAAHDTLSFDIESGFRLCLCTYSKRQRMVEAMRIMDRLRLDAVHLVQHLTTWEAARRPATSENVPEMWQILSYGW